MSINLIEPGAGDLTIQQVARRTGLAEFGAALLRTHRAGRVGAAVLRTHRADRPGTA